jgi:uncharacterized Zn finger protein
MEKKTGCKKCGAKDYDFQESKIYKKTIYYIKCNSCGNLTKVNLTKIACLLFKKVFLGVLAWLKNC